MFPYPLQQAVHCLASVLNRFIRCDSYSSLLIVLAWILLQNERETEEKIKTTKHGSAKYASRDKKTMAAGE